MADPKITIIPPPTTQTGGNSDCYPTPILDLVQIGDVRAQTSDGARRGLKGTPLSEAIIGAVGSEHLVGMSRKICGEAQNVLRINIPKLALSWTRCRWRKRPATHFQKG